MFLGVVMMSSLGVAVLAPESVGALGGGNCGVKGVLGFKPWYYGLCDNDTKNSPITTPSKNDEAELARFVWTIVLNILVDLMVAVGYLALGFVIYGGYLYIMSQGDPGKAMKGKKTLTNAIIGTVIALMASILVNTVRVILGISDNNSWDQGGKDYTVAQIQDVFNWAYTVAGIVAVIFIIKNAVNYMVSHGDPGKTKQATQGIIYAVVGLVIVLLAAMITTFVITAINGANAAVDTASIVTSIRRIG